MELVRLYTIVPGEFDDGLDDELMGDEEDRRKLEMMNEKEREEEIFKRAEKREMLKKRYEIEKKLKLQKRSSKGEQLSKGLDTKERSRARVEAVENKKDKKTMALDVLKAKRKEKQELQQKLVTIHCSFLIRHREIVFDVNKYHHQFRELRTSKQMTRYNYWYYTHVNVKK